MTPLYTNGIPVLVRSYNGIGKRCGMDFSFISLSIESLNITGMVRKEFTLKQISDSKGNVKSGLQSYLLYFCLNHTFLNPKQSRIILSVCICVYIHTHTFFSEISRQQKWKLKKYEVSYHGRAPQKALSVL